MFIEIQTIDSVCNTLSVKAMTARIEPSANGYEFYAMNAYYKQVGLQGEYSSDLASLIKDKYPECRSWVCTTGYVKFSFETAEGVAVTITLT